MTDSTVTGSNRLKGKIALVTGGARGIGEACAELFAKEGATVIVTDILDDLGEEVAKRIGGVYRHLDVSSEDEWKGITDFVAKEYKRLDVLVNNAGITGFAETPGPYDPENLDLDSWHQVNAVNMDGVALGCKYAISLMKEKGGSIVNISSRSGMVGIPGAAAYAASKAAVRNHSKSVALYCAQKGYKIRCNSIHPAAILTPIWEPMLGTGEERKKSLAKVESGIPLGAMGEAIDVAYAALFLATHESKYITGSELTVDGGILAGSAASPK